MDGCSVRKICDRAGASTGLINYHFGSIDDLVAACYQQHALSILNTAIQASLETGDPRTQLSIFLKTIFEPQLAQPNIFRAWLVFWAMIDSAAPIREANRKSNGETHKFLETIFSKLINDAGTAMSPRMAAKGLSALIDGLWLDCCLQAETADVEECIVLCERWVDAARDTAR